MNIAVPIRHVVDLIEPMTLVESQTQIDYDDASFVINETDDHALEQALLLSDRIPGSSVIVMAVDFGDVDASLYAALAKGAAKAIRVAYDGDQPPSADQAAAAFAQLVRELECELVLAGSYAHGEIDGMLGPALAHELQWPYVGVVRGVRLSGEAADRATVFKEFPGAVMAELTVSVPAVIGVVGAEQPPRYVPVSRIRSVMKSSEIEDRELTIPEGASHVEIARFEVPSTGQRAQMLSGDTEELVMEVAKILHEQGISP